MSLLNGVKLKMFGGDYHLPGEGASTPVVWQDKIFLTSADEGPPEEPL